MLILVLIYIRNMICIQEYYSFFIAKKNPFFFLKISPQCIDQSQYFFACGLKQISLNWKPEMGLICSLNRHVSSLSLLINLRVKSFTVT